MSTETVQEGSLGEDLTAAFRKYRGIYGRLDLSAQISLWVVVGIILMAIAAPAIAPYEPDVQDYDASLQPPSMDHPLGTDLTGRDILSRIIFGSRASLMVGLLAVSAAILVGVPLGSIAGYIGGWLDEFIMRFMDVVISVPALVLGLAIVGTLGASIWNVILVVAIAYSPQYARLIRGSVLSVKEEEYVEAAENIGLTNTNVLLKHIVPNALTPVLVQASYHIATAIILEASLSFLGLGVQPPRPTWGVIIANGRAYLPAEWWISTFPGIAIMITVLSFNLLGDGLRDEFDPRSATEAGGGA